MPVAVLPSLSEPSAFEIYCSNQTTYEPLPTELLPTESRGSLAHTEGSESVDPLQRGAWGRTRGSSMITNSTLLRYTTRDFRTYSEPHVACSIPGGVDFKSIARDDASGRYAMVVHYNRASFTLVSDDAGLNFRQLPTGDIPGGHYGDKDDLNLIYNKGRFVDMQIVYQEWPLRYCDNAGCDRRRVISAKTSRYACSVACRWFALLTPLTAAPVLAATAATGRWTWA